MVINDSVHTISPLSFQNVLYLLACCGLGLAVVVTDMVAMLVVVMIVTIIIELWYRACCIPGTIPNTRCKLILSSQHPYGIGTNISPRLQVRKLRYREGK